MWDIEITEDERVAMERSVRNSLDLYRRYIKLPPETTAMKRRQASYRKRIVHLETALEKLK